MTSLRKLGALLMGAALLAASIGTARAQDYDSGGGDAAAGGILAFMGLFYCGGFILAIVTLVGLWKIFEKAGKPGWAAIVPIYNVIVLTEIVGRPMWWVALLFVPCVNVVVQIVLAMDLAKSMGQSPGMGIAAAFFPYVVYPMWGFGGAQYQGPSVQPGSGPI